MKRITVGALGLLTVLAGAGCDDLFGPKRSPGALQLSPRVLMLDDAATGQLTLTVLDRDGEAYSEIPKRLTLSWSASPQSIASVQDGLVTANRPGQAYVHVRSGSLADSARILVSPVPTRMDVGGGAGHAAPACSSLPDSVTVRVVDRHGDGVSGVRVEFRVVQGGGAVAPSLQFTDGAGYARARWRLGEAPGPQRLEATSDVALDGAPASVDAEAQERLPPVIAAVEPAILVAGEAAIIHGEHLDADPSCVTLEVGGRPAAVLEASATRLTVQLPPRAQYACEPRRPVPVELTLAGFTVTREDPLEVGIDRSLPVGGSALVLDAAEVRCTRIEAPGRYFLSVFNTLTTTGTSAFELRGVAGLETGGDRIAAAVTITPPGPVPEIEADLHFRILEENRRLVERLGPIAAAAGAPPLAGDGVPEVGQTLTIQVPDFQAGNACQNTVPRPARVVYVGERAIVLEDVDAPLAGTMDVIYRAIGEEWDAEMFPVLRAYFGDPLRLNSQTSGHGRVLMMFTQRVNQMGGIFGFVFAGDLYPTAQCAGSNRAEIFYAFVPTRSGSDLMDWDFADGWHHQMRSTVIHEGKHIVSFAERLARPSPTFEESWLEEATARISEEIWARTYYGYGQHGNAGYAESIHCERRPADPTCGGRPVAMWKHFNGLYTHHRNVERCSPLGPTVSNLCGASFYGSGWSFARWVADHYGGSEIEFFNALTQDATRSGIDNLEARSGRPYAELLGGWTLANVVDGWPDIALSGPEMGHPSWNTRDVFAGLAADLPDRFVASPLSVRRIEYGEFLVPVGEVRGGSAAYFELTGAATGVQMIEVRGAGGSPPPTTLRIGIVRVE